MIATKFYPYRKQGIWNRLVKFKLNPMVGFIIILVSVKLCIGKNKPKTDLNVLE
jgi:hypothetical protein